MIIQNLHTSRKENQDDRQILNQLLIMLGKTTPKTQHQKQPQKQTQPQQQKQKQTQEDLNMTLT